MSPWIGYQSVSISYESYFDFNRIIEYEAFYNFGVYQKEENLTLSDVRTDLNSEKFSGGINVIVKKQKSVDSNYYWAYEGGYRYFAFENSHTICTEVGVSTSDICNCTKFTENNYQRSINQLSTGLRIGWQTPVSKYYKRLRFDFFMGIGGRLAFGKNRDKLSHMFCDGNVESLHNDYLKKKDNNSFQYFKDEKLSLIAPYFVTGLKLGYAF